MHYYFTLMHQSLPQCTQLTELDFNFYEGSSYFSVQDQFLELISQMPLERLTLSGVDHYSRLAINKNLKGMTQLSRLAIHFREEYEAPRLGVAWPNTFRDTWDLIATLYNLTHLTVEIPTSQSWVDQIPATDLLSYLIHCPLLQYVNLQMDIVDATQLLAWMALMPYLEEIHCSLKYPSAKIGSDLLQLRGCPMLSVFDIPALNHDLSLSKGLLSETNIVHIHQLKAEHQHKIGRLLKRNQMRHGTLENFANANQQQLADRTTNLLWPVNRCGISKP